MVLGGGRFSFDATMLSCHATSVLGAGFQQSVATVRAGALANFADVGKQVGLDVRRVMRDAGLDWELLSEPDRRVPTDAVAKVLETAAIRANCQTLGLRMAEARRLSDFGAVSLLIAHQPSLRDALESIVRYRHLLNEALAMSVEEADDLAILREELVLEGHGTARQAYELAIGTMYRMFGALLGPRWRPYGIGFTHSPPADLSVHRRLFGCDVRFNNDFNGIVFWRQSLDLPNPAADPAMAEYARKYVEAFAPPRPEPTPVEVLKTIHLLMPVGRASIPQVANWLRVSVRTLQRRLSADGKDFSDLLNGARRDLALRYLQSSDLSATEIARLLGYGQLSSFTRWFKDEFGVAPSNWPRRRESA
jgi:AraC-like DNA-binding protein